ncbi:MAG: PaaI family thioesterase [Woeseiaceae bacterium]
MYEGTYIEFLGFRLTAWKEGFARLEMPVRPEHRNTVGFLHGGVMASLLDIAGAVSGSYGISEDFVSVTINLNCNFMSPHKVPSVIVEGELIRVTKSMFFAQSKLFDPQNKRLCATATGTYKRQPRNSKRPTE